MTHYIGFMTCESIVDYSLRRQTLKHGVLVLGRWPCWSEYGDPRSCPQPARKDACACAHQ